MDRRTFTKSLAAVMTLPAMPSAALAAPSAAVSVPSQARYWAIYMNSLHGQCTPRALQVMLNIPHAQAEGYLGQLMAEGVIKPNPLMTGIKNALRPSTQSKALEDAETKIKEELKQVIEHVEDVDPKDNVEEDAQNEQDTA